MSEQYRCSECGHCVEILDDAICDVCNIGKMQHLRYIRGGDGSHWEGCADVHWDCKIDKLTAELARLTADRDGMAEENRMLSERLQRQIDGNVHLTAELARRDASLLTEGEQKEILSYIRGNYDRDKIPTWLLDLIDGIARRDEQTGNHLMWMAEQGTIITGLRDELKERDEIIARLKEDGERLRTIVGYPYEIVAENNDSVFSVCKYCTWIQADKKGVAYIISDSNHAPDCPITLHRALMKELE